MLKQRQSAEISPILDKLFSLQRLGIKVGLDHTIQLLNRCGNPHNKLKTIHIAGTNGKGSTAAILQSILRTAGLKVGLYTSPHLVSFNERIRVNGSPISNDFIIDFMKKFNDDINEIESTFFETTTVLSLCYFYFKKVDVAIIETGLGGRLDSTNVLNPNLSIITSIDIDHQNILGNTIEEIANEKAGIIKKNTPLITFKQPKKILDILRNRAKTLNAKIEIVVDPQKIVVDNFSTKFVINNKTFSIPLIGEHQAYNAALAIRSSNIFMGPLSYQMIKDGVKNTVWPGRFQLLNNKLKIFYDVAHNSAGINTIRSTLNSLNALEKIGLIILKEDKDVDQISNSLKGLFDELIISTVPNAQLMSIDELNKSLNRCNIICKPIDPIEKAFNYILDKAEKGAVTIIFGSHYAARSIYKFFEINFDNVTI
ncbi:MAG: folylpolyglutamate synthase/dihydrofolate synthase family protein [Candidatus Neomarinimicrobiota bacterium]|nr:folylpolyglutamate synthase/dihydrofolate synthase family protein [Candidatus Neomarinimicrobiota bacterium]MED5266157.1 folylpolyglutamate synthase/dihydrofolate synthase family protein [Candidatus Neomarinimicrobiota bacterium]